MSDLIDRQAAIDAPVKMVSEGLDWIPVYHIKGLPSAQPEDKCGECDAWNQYKNYTRPDIVYCKDCKHWDTSWENNFAPNYHYCPLIDGTRSGDFYCADAERRTDEQTD